MAKGGAGEQEAFLTVDIQEVRDAEVQQIAGIAQAITPTNRHSHTTGYSATMPLRNIGVAI
ncbi:Uncharacterised protein [Serratia rubidaea]|uniref:Uncharacterized protein n=1 Tax=Serratia rubidaea TaxID=61652 RepID=A0A4U9HG30_SERRU|nr:Uncharacterised protein [Serratia rubidaea]